MGDQVLLNDIDLLNPPAKLEKRKHKLKRLVQSPNSFFMVLILTLIVFFFFFFKFMCGSFIELVTLGSDSVSLFLFFFLLLF